MADFKDSFEQQTWEHYLGEWNRMKEWLVKHQHPIMQNYARARIDEIELRYPQLKDK